MHIRITQEHIDDARAVSRPKTLNCPVARAMNDATGKKWSVGASYAGLYHEGFTTDMNLKLSRAIRTFIQMFDAGRKVYPSELDYDEEAHTISDVSTEVEPTPTLV